MTKSIKTLVAVVALAVSFTSCSQEEAPVPTPVGDLRVEAAGKYDYFMISTEQDGSLDTTQTFSDMELFVDETSTTLMTFNFSNTFLEVTSQDATGFDCIVTDKDIEGEARWNRNTKTLVWIIPVVRGIVGEVTLIATKRETK